MVWRLGQGSSGNQVVIRVSCGVKKVEYTRPRSSIVAAYCNVYNTSARPGTDSEH